MDDYIIDASVLVKGYVQEKQTENVLALLAQVPDQVTLHIPEFCLVECTSILWKYVRFHGMPLPTADQAAADLADLTLVIHPAASYLRDALKVGVDHELAIYDALYIILAQDLDMSLLTADRKQQRAAEAYRVSLKPLEDFIPV